MTKDTKDLMFLALEIFNLRMVQTALAHMSSKSGSIETTLFTPTKFGASNTFHHDHVQKTKMKQNGTKLQTTHI